MAQLHKIQGQIQLKCQAEQYFDLWAHKIYLVQKICPDKVQKSILNEGEWHKPGCVLTGYYVISNIGEIASLKTKVEEIDEMNKVVVHSYLEGYIMENYYKTFKNKVQVSPKGNKGCNVTYSFEYEKMNENAPNANVYVDFLLAMAKDIDAYLCKN